MGTGSSSASLVDVDADPEHRQGEAGVHPLDQDPADLEVVDQHVVGPLQRRDPGERAGDGVPGQQRQPGPPLGVASGSKTAENVSAAPGGVTQARSSRPRPASWWSATTTRWLPGSAAASALVEPASASATSAVRPQPEGGLVERRPSGRSVSRRDWRATREATVSAATHPDGSPGAGTDGPTDIDIHTTAGKLADLERRVDEAVHAGSATAVEKQHARGSKTARERIELLFDEDSFIELDEFARHRSTAFGMREASPVRRRRGHRLRHRRRPPGLRVQSGRHRLRRQPRRGVRREDHQGHGLRPQDRLPHDRDQRGRRGADPGGCRLARSVRRDLPPQHARLRA